MVCCGRGASSCTRFPAFFFGSPRDFFNGPLGVGAALTGQGRPSNILGMQLPLAFIGGLGTVEITLILVVGLVLFGGRLPEVGKSVAKSLLEFKKGLRDLKDEAGLREIEDIRDDVNRDVSQLAQAPDYAYRRGSLAEGEQEFVDAALADDEQRYPDGAEDDAYLDDGHEGAYEGNPGGDPAPEIDESETLPAPTKSESSKSEEGDESPAAEPEDDRPSKEPPSFGYKS
jgi:sec-independent protein translocase protein TatA